MPTPEEDLTRLQAFVGRQALKIADLESELSNARAIAARVQLRRIACGGPLNDNVLGYTEKQLRDFFEIQRLIEPLIPIV